MAAVGRLAEAQKAALLIASANYEDPQLRRLRAPAQDVEALDRVLRDTAIGAFDVRIVMDERSWKVHEEIEEFFADRRRDDLLLLYISCHGLKDPTGRLYFAAPNTRVKRLGSTGISAAWVNEQIDRSLSRRIVLLLDCCFSGAFARGLAPRHGGAVDIGEPFEARGQAILTASDAMEYAYEGDDLAFGFPQPSVFTRALVHGLETGEADRDRDGWVAVNELYEYVHDAVRETTSAQTPTMSVVGLEGELRLARNPRWSTAGNASNRDRHVSEGELARATRAERLRLIQQRSDEACLAAVKELKAIHDLLDGHPSTAPPPSLRTHVQAMKLQVGIIVGDDARFRLEQLVGLLENAYAITERGAHLTDIVQTVYEEGTAVLAATLRDDPPPLSSARLRGYLEFVARHLPEQKRVSANLQANARGSIAGASERPGGSLREGQRGLDRYFSTNEYVVNSFGKSCFVTLQLAADHDDLPQSQRVQDRGYSYFPYFELKNGAPEIYASQQVGGHPACRWITLDTTRHGVGTDMYRAPSAREKWVLLLHR